MENNSKKFTTVFLLCVAVSIAFSYYNFVVKENFEVFTDEEAFNEALLEE